MQKEIELAKMRKLINRLPAARFRLDKAMSRATKTTTILTGMPRGSGGNSQVEEGALLIMLAREKYESMKEELSEMQAEISPLIEGLANPLQRAAMRMRYMEGRSVREIAYGLNYSEQHIFRILQRAEREL